MGLQKKTNGAPAQLKNGSVKSQAAIVIDDGETIHVDAVCLPPHVRPHIQSVLITQGMVQDRLQRMALDIVADIETDVAIDHDNRPVEVTMLCVMNGAFRFAADLMTHIGSVMQTRRADSITPPLAFTMDFIRLKSYVNTESTGDEVQVLDSGAQVVNRLTGKHVLIVEDLIDTGRTMQKLVSLIQGGESGCRRGGNTASLRIACLINKRTDRRLADAIDFTVDYVGFDIPDKFIIGYGFDFNEMFRDLNHVCVINEAGIAAYRQ